MVGRRRLLILPKADNRFDRQAMVSNKLVVEKERKCDHI